MYRSFLLLALLLTAGAVPAFAEGFSQAQFVGLILVNLALGAVVTLFLVVLASVFYQKLKGAKEVKVPAQARKSGV